MAMPPPGFRPDQPVPAPPIMVPPPPPVPAAAPVPAPPPPFYETSDLESLGAPYERPVNTGMLSPQDHVRLREVRVDLQEIVRLLESAKNGDFALADYGAYFNKLLADVSSRLGTIRVNGPESDSVRKIENLWDQVLASPLILEPSTTRPAVEEQRYLTILVEVCNRVINEIGVLTIPPRLNEWLMAAKPGYYVPFHAVFQDEMPDTEARNVLLQHLAWAPLALRGGLVDPAGGLIYRYADSKFERLMSFLLIGLTAVVTGMIVAGAAHLPVEGWPLDSDDLSKLLIGWGAILVGVLVHLGIGVMKRSQSDAKPPLLSIADMPLLANAHAGRIILKLFMTLVGLFGLALTAGTDELTPWTAFLVGYALDSVVELFGAGADQLANTRLGKVRGQLGP